MTEVYLALGSNVGDSRQTIEHAIELLAVQALSQIKQAPLYRSKAVGYTKQADFLNTAISGQTELEPAALLAVIQDIEHQLGRRERFRWGPREIDIDLIFYGDLVLETPELTIPHPAFRDRDFVLRPLVDLNPNLIDPVSSQTTKQLLDQFSSRSQKSIID